MSADPDEPVIANRLTGGHVIKNMIYKHKPGNEMEVMTGWNDGGGCREYNQEIVSPARLEGLHKKHPCFALNEKLIKCSLQCPNEMKLGGRTAMCNEPRKELMQCFTRNKKWEEPAEQPWYRRLL